AQEWDRLALADRALGERFEFVYAGFDLFRFPENARLLTFDVRRDIERLVAWARRCGVCAVISPNEHFGVLMAAVIAQRLGLPGPDPKAVLTAQHKYYARAALEHALPETNPRFAVFPHAFRDSELPLAFPFFVKPVKATFSVLARRVDTPAELRRHLRLRPFERYLVDRLLRPFNDLLAERGDAAIDAYHLLGEGLVEGLQVNVDGYAERGRIRILGIVDELMYPGTHAFNRFEYPSSLPPEVQARLRDVARRAIRAVGFDHGLFNVELAYDPRGGTIRVIEINPRVASQFVTLYDWVDGTRFYELMLDLALGETPRLDRCAPLHRCAASFVLRSFDGRAVRPAPSRAQIARVAERHPDARLMLYLKRGADLAREMKWLGSHRYAVVNVGGEDRAGLYARYRDIRAMLGFERHAEPEPAPMWSAESVAARAAGVPGFGG
ncbi:MAG: ATP-grasp domain-containing protein, partial [Burkholderiales bacterium]|nr:ATP-grasp domain-containing protein [Burkholderiales bacterium]